MYRLIISNGSYTTLLITSILKDKNQEYDCNIFLGYFKKIKPQNLATHYDFANIGIPYDNHYNFNDFYHNNSFNFKKLQQDSKAGFDEIYIPINSTTKKWVKIFQKTYPNAVINLYEEGLMSYIKPMFDKKLRKIMEKTHNHYVLYSSKLESILKGNCPTVTFNKISKESILNTINMYSKSLSISFDFDPSKKYALILPQYYFDSSKAKTQVMLEEYQKVIDKLISDGYEILFKEHPKAKQSFFSSLKNTKHSDKIHLIENISNYPIELFISQLNIKLAFSVYSTSLLTINYLFDIPVFTSNKLLKQRCNYFSIYPTLSTLLIKKIIPSIEEKNNIKKHNFMVDLYIFLLKKLL